MRPAADTMRGGCRRVPFCRKVGAKERRVEAFAQWLAATSFSRGIARKFWLIPVLQSINTLSIAFVLSWAAMSPIESIHVIALTLVVGSIAIVDLRLLGLASTKRSYAELAREVLPWTWLCFGLAVISGSLMFISQPVGYFGNLAFRRKILLLCLAGINMLVFQLITGRGASKWRQEHAVPISGKIAASLSLALWMAVVFLGRWVGFTMTPA